MMDEYFRNPVPFLSDNNVEYICKEIDLDQIILK